MEIFWLVIFASSMYVIYNLLKFIKNNRTVTKYKEYNWDNVVFCNHFKNAGDFINNRGRYPNITFNVELYENSNIVSGVTHLTINGIGLTAYNSDQIKSYNNILIKKNRE